MPQDRNTIDDVARRKRPGPSHRHHDGGEVTLLLLMGRRSVKGWYSGTAMDSQDTLAFSVLAGIRSMNEVYPLEKVAEAYERMESGKAPGLSVTSWGRLSRRNIASMSTRPWVISR